MLLILFIPSSAQGILIWAQVVTIVVNKYSRSQYSGVTQR